jgi:hypothetical protein
MILQGSGKSTLIGHTEQQCCGCDGRCMTQNQTVNLNDKEK